MRPTGRLCEACLNSYGVVCIATLSGGLRRCQFSGLFDIVVLSGWHDGVGVPGGAGERSERRMAVVSRLAFEILEFAEGAEELAFVGSFIAKGVG